MQVTGEQCDPPGPPAAIRDETKVWEGIAAAQYKADGDEAGWESDVSDEESPDDKYIRVSCCHSFPRARGAPDGFPAALTGTCVLRMRSMRCSVVFAVCESQTIQVQAPVRVRDPERMRL